jgi:acyltransferase
MQTQRYSWIDIARGIGMIFVIYAHMLGSNGIRYLFYGFHMPLFFFLSGVVLKNSDNFTTLLKKSVKRLLIPYFIFAFTMYFIWIINIKDHNIFSPENMKQFFSIFYGNSNNRLMVFNDALWFLPALFVTKILYAIITIISKKTKFVILFLLFFSIFGYLFSIYAPTVKLLFGTEIAFSAVVFYGIGFLWNRSNGFREPIHKYKYLLFPVLLILGIILTTIDFHIYGHQIDMRLNHLNNYFLFYIDAFMGIFAWIAFSIILNKNKMLETIGKNSLILFAWHPIVFYYLGLISTAYINPQITDNFLIIIPAIYTIISISIILFINRFLNYVKQYKR